MSTTHLKVDLHIARAGHDLMLMPQTPRCYRWLINHVSHELGLKILSGGFLMLHDLPFAQASSSEQFHTAFVMASAEDMFQQPLLVERKKVKSTLAAIALAGFSWLVRTGGRLGT